MTHPQPLQGDLVRWEDLTPYQRRLAVAAYAAMGKSGAEMARLLNTTRDAVLGVATRAKIKVGGDTVRRIHPPQPSRLPMAREVDPAVWALTATATTSPTRKECCWPVGEGPSNQMFCGAPKARGSYCAAHAAMAFAPRAGDSGFAAALAAGRTLAWRLPEVTIQEAVAVVRPRADKVEGIE